MTNPKEIPATQNEGWGFRGTMGEHAAEAWPVAMSMIASATGEPHDNVRLFLDSRFGRHFADEVHNRLFEGLSLSDAIHSITERWMTKKIGPRTSSHYGIPCGMNYLIGFINHCVIVEESAA